MKARAPRGVRSPAISRDRGGNAIGVGALRRPLNAEALSMVWGGFEETLPRGGFEETLRRKREV
jgi:hypothetical protein